MAFFKYQKKIKPVKNCTSFESDEHMTLSRTIGTYYRENCNACMQVTSHQDSPHGLNRYKDYAILTNFFSKMHWYMVQCRRWSRRDRGLKSYFPPVIHDLQSCIWPFCYIWVIGYFTAKAHNNLNICLQKQAKLAM